MINAFQAFSLDIKFVILTIIIAYVCFLKKWAFFKNFTYVSEIFLQPHYLLYGYMLIWIGLFLQSHLYRFLVLVCLAMD